MNLAIVHYHLNRGGVTRVIENHLRALDAVLTEGERWQVGVFYGGRQHGWHADLSSELARIALSLCEVPLLEYDSEREDATADPAALVRAITETLQILRFSPHDSVIHVHNHSLGKNVSLPTAVCSLADQGYPILLEPHDFAEDFRPDNFVAITKLRDQNESSVGWHGSIYPQASHIHYAVLNGRDKTVLHTAGVEPDRLHLLPNPVLKIEGIPEKETVRKKLAEGFSLGLQQRLVLYPVRCIRRKNLGEALLYSALVPTDTVVGLTLAPINPQEVIFYNQWKQFAAELELPCRFELGDSGGLTFAENMGAADLLLSTSLAEGFGMVFLESWLAGRCLVGRDLPEITADFKKSGVQLNHLQRQLRVPIEWVGLNSFRRKVLDEYHRTLACYGREEPRDEAEALESKTANGLVDFGDLNETFQQQVLRIVTDSQADRRRLLDLNPCLCSCFAMCENADDLIGENVDAINRSFSLIPSGDRIRKLYQRVLDSKRDKKIRPLPYPDKILDQFLDLRRFRLIRS